MFIEGQTQNSVILSPQLKSSSQSSKHTTANVYPVTIHVFAYYSYYNCLIIVYYLISIRTTPKVMALTQLFGQSN